MYLARQLGDATRLDIQALDPLSGADVEELDFVYATGHGRNGILLAPITGDIVRDLVVSGATSWDISMCASTRF